MSYKLPTINLFNFTVSTWGCIDGLLLRPGDRLQVNTPVHGDLVIVQCQVSQQLRFGRFYAGVVLSEPHAKPLNSPRWKVITGITAVERPLGSGVVEGRKWQVALHGAPLSFQLHFGVNDREMDAVYLEELGRQLAEYTPECSVVVSEKKEWAQQLLSKCPQGVIWFHLRRYESHPIAEANYAAWLSSGKRKQRRFWDKRIELSAERQPYATLPEMIEVEESLAS